MPAQAQVQTEIDATIQAEAAAVLAPMGLTVADAVKLLLTRIAHDHALPFDPLIPNAETIAAMEEARHGNLASAATIEQFLDAMRAPD
ncbi:type II toxin-antitoxin system RelB/DinJ family antitoxin [Methylomagnum sp.]